MMLQLDALKALRGISRTGRSALPSMAADYDWVSIKCEDLWDVAVRGSQDDKIERRGTRIEKIPKKEIRGR
jgi:hypothetical protein